MRPLRVVLTLLVMAGAWVLIDLTAWRPYRCGRTEKTLETLTLRIFDGNDPYRVNSMARQVVANAERCLRQTPGSVELYMIAGAGYRILGRPADAISKYREALRYDRRPELYLNLGLAELQAGLHKEAFDSLLTACVFRSDFLTEIPPPTREEIEVALRAYLDGKRTLPLLAEKER